MPIGQYSIGWVHDLIGYGRNSYDKLANMLNTKVSYGMHRAYELTSPWKSHLKTHTAYSYCGACD